MEKRIVFTGTNIIVLLDGGEVLSTSQGNMDMYNALNNAETLQEVKKIIAPELLAKQEEKEEEEVRIEIEREEVQATINSFQPLLDMGEFEFVNDCLYLKGIKRSIPELLAKEFLQTLEKSDMFMSLKRFWYWTCLNPRAEIADGLFTFLKKNHLRINSQGFFYALRNVVTVAEDTSLVDFVSEQYTKIKLRKKGPANYFVYKTKDEEGIVEYVLGKGEDLLVDEDDDNIYEKVGNLKELYLDLPNLAENRYTDWKTKTFDIRIGQKVSMPPEDCRWENVDCGAAGLHFTMNQLSYVKCGDKSIIILINPMKVVGLGSNKGRCYEYLPICTISEEDAVEFLRNGEFDTLDMEAEYAAEELQDLEQKVRESFVTEAKKYSFNLPQISSEEVKSISDILKGAKEQLSGRIKNFSVPDTRYHVKNEDFQDNSEDEDYDFEDEEDEDFDDDDDE